MRGVYEKFCTPVGGSTKNNVMACAGVGSLACENSEISGDVPKIFDPLRGVYEKFSLEGGGGLGKFYEFCAISTRYPTADNK